VHRFSRGALFVAASVALVSSGVVAGVAVGGGGGGVAAVAPAVVAQASAETPASTDQAASSDLTNEINRINYALAAQLATPQNIANAFAFTQGVAALKH